MTDSTVPGSMPVLQPPAPGQAAWAPRKVTKVKPRGRIKEFTASLTSIFAGALISGSLVIILTATHAALVFSPQQPEMFSIGLQMALMSTIVLSAFAALFSSIKSATAFTQDVTSVSIAVLAVTVLAAFPEGISAPEQLSTLLATIALVTLSTGTFFYVLGRLRLGKLIRFTPIPVIGGFLAATGWLIMKGALSITLAQTITLDNASTFMAADNLPRLAAASTVALIAIIAVWRFANPVIVPIVVLVSVAVFHLIVFAANLDYADLAASGWLANVTSVEAIQPIVFRIDAASVDWQIVLQQFPLMLTVLTVGTIALLMNSSSLELALSRDVDLDMELRAAGGGNIVASMLGGMPGYIGFSPTVLNHRLGGRHRLGGLIIAAMAASVLYFGSSAMSLIPLPVLGGLLLWLGASLVYDWLYLAWFKVSWPEYLVMTAILIVVVFVGMLEGVFTGLIAGIILFVVDYSRIEVIKTQLTAKQFNSRREMPELWREHMRQHGGSIVILKLQGFIFFGTAHQLVERISSRLRSADQAKVRFLVLDFRHTSGIDSSAVLSFIKLERIAIEQRFKVVMTNVDGQIHKTLNRGGFAQSELTPVRIFDDLDDGLRWSENKLIYSVAPSVAEISSVPIREKLIGTDITSPVVQRMLSYMERQELDPETVLIEQGTSSSDMYFIESGKYGVLIDRGDGAMLKVSTLLPGAVAGEMAFYAGRRRSASVICEEPGVVWRFTRENLKRMQEAEPNIAYHLHERMAALLAERLGGTTRLVQHLAD